MNNCRLMESNLSMKSLNVYLLGFICKYVYAHIYFLFIFFFSKFYQQSVRVWVGVCTLDYTSKHLISYAAIISSVVEFDSHSCNKAALIAPFQVISVYYCLLVSVIIQVLPPTISNLAVCCLARVCVCMFAQSIHVANLLNL